MHDCGKHGGADTSRGAGAELPTPKSRRKCLGPRQRGDRFRKANRRFFDVNPVRNEENKKSSNIKVAPNKVLKTNLEKSDIFDYPNKVLKQDDLTEISY
jgi:hypothetical protein